jgi:hypothetical protein
MFLYFIELGYPNIHNHVMKNVNEDGLPIIEITEPLPNADSPGPNERTPVLDEPEIVPLNSLTPSERDRRRVQRDRILDFLEEEERKEQLRTEELEREERRESVRKRKVALGFEIEKLKATKVLQKKMGKALLTSLANDRERVEKVQEGIPARDTKEALPKKKVTFAEEPGGQIDWGDVTPATLGPMNRNSLISKARQEKHQVMRDVVERLPLGVIESQQHCINEADSDDESNPDHALPSNPDEDEDVRTMDDSEDDGSNSIEDENLEPPESEEEYDLDAARHQREIALEYIKKRGIIGKDMATVLTSHAHSKTQDEWDQPVRVFQLESNYSCSLFVGGTTRRYPFFSSTKATYISLQSGSYCVDFAGLVDFIIHCLADSSRCNSNWEA